MEHNRDPFVDRITTYFTAMDRGDVDATTACFAPNGTLTCETNEMHLTGLDELREFFQRITDNTYEMTHAVHSTIVDVPARKAAAELQYSNRRKTGPDIATAVCNVFDFDIDGRFTHVRFWTADVIRPAAVGDARRIQT